MKRLVALVVLAILVAASAFVTLGPRTVPGASMDAPDGMAAWAEASSHEIQRSTASILLALERAGDDTLLVVAGAKQPFTAQEAAAAVDFLHQGGRILLAEEGGHAGSLLAPLGIGFERAAILAPGGATAIGFRIADTEYELVANVPTTVIAPDDAQIVAHTSADAFVDRDHDGTFSRHDPPGPHAVAARMDVGHGVVLVLGSLDLLRDSHAQEDAAWRTALLRSLLPSGGTIIFDESRQGHGGPAVTSASLILQAATDSPGRWILSAMAAVMVAAIWIDRSTFSPWGPHAPEPGRPRLRSTLTQLVGRGMAPDARDPSADRPRQRGLTALGKRSTGLGGMLMVFGLVVDQAAAVLAGAVLLVLVMAAVLRRMPRVSATRSPLPERGMEGNPVAVEVRVDCKRPIEIRDGVAPVVDADGTTWCHTTERETWLRYDASPRVRGPCTFGPVRFRSTDPFGLHTIEGPVGDTAAVEVMPRAQDLRELPVRIRRPEILQGMHSVNRAGEGSEFHALRDYQAGDPIRSVNWRASARSRSLMVNQRVLESQTQLTLILDGRTIAEAGPAEHTPLAEGARIMATLIHAGAQGRDRVRLLVYGAEVHEIPPASAFTFRHQSGQLLSRYAAIGDMPFADVAQSILADVRPGTAVLVVSGLESDETMVDGIRRLAARGAHVSVLAPPLGTGPGEDRDAIMAARMEVVRALRSAGANVHESRPGLPLQDLFRVEVAR